MAMVNLSGLMVVNIMDNGMMITCMELAFIFGLMNDTTSVFIKMIINMGLGYIKCPMNGFILETGF